MESVERLKENPIISVIMLIYNREKLVSRMIESILAQTLRNFEYIIVDNGSTDGSRAIAEDYAKRDTRISIYKREAGNIGSGRNVGLSAAKGEYITFIDDDDWCEPDFLEFLHRLLVENNADVSICGASDRSFDEKIIMTAEEALMELMWRKRYTMAFPTKMFIRDHIPDIWFPEDTKYDDISQMHRLLSSAKIVAYHGIPKYTFYRHDDNHSKWTTNHSLLTPDTLDEYLCAYHNRTVWLSEKFPRSEAAWKYFEWSFMISMTEKIIRLNIRGCESQLEDMQKILHKNRDEFLRSTYVKDFEKDWLDQYIK